VVTWFDGDARVDRSLYLRASDARQLVEGLTDDLGSLMVSVPGGGRAQGADYWDVFERITEALVDEVTTQRR
jgi:hypothetical protein